MTKNLANFMAYLSWDPECKEKNLSKICCQKLTIHAMRKNFSDGLILNSYQTHGRAAQSANFCISWWTKILSICYRTKNGSSWGIPGSQLPSHLCQNTRASYFGILSLLIFLWLIKLFSNYNELN